MATTLAALSKDLAAGRWPAVVLVSGEDSELRHAALGALVDALPEDERQTAVDRFDEGPLVRALDAARSPSLLGGRRIVVVSEPGVFTGGDAAEKQALSAWLEAPAPHATLVLFAAKVDGRLSIVKAIAKHGVRLEAVTPRERDMPGWIVERARARGLRLTPPIVQAIADAVGTDTSLAARELDKLVLLSEPGEGQATLDASVVGDVLRPGRAVGAFALEDALLAGRTGEALGLLERHLAGAGTGEPLAILARLSGIARRLIVAHAVVARGGGESELREALACHPFVAKKYSQAARRIGVRGEPALAAAVAADGMLKSGRSARAALSNVVCALGPGVARAAGPSRRPIPRRHS